MRSNQMDASLPLNWAGGTVRFPMYFDIKQPEIILQLEKIQSDLSLENLFDNHQFRGTKHEKYTILREIFEFIFTEKNSSSKEKPVNIEAIVKHLEDEAIASINSFNPNLTFIPILRNTKQMVHGQDNDILRDRTNTDYFWEERLQENIFSGEQIFGDVKDHLHSNSTSKRLIRSFENFLSKTFYSAQPVDISTPEFKDSEAKSAYTGDTGKRLNNYSLKFKIGPDEHFMPDLGDGIEAISILTYPLFTKKEGEHIMFIEEPELNLHPGMQRVFLETLARDEFKNTQVFINTHSNHFLDMSLDMTDKISVYSFHKKQRTVDSKSKSYFEIKQVAGPDKEVLQNIGVRNSSVFLSNCTIWVEGITDRLYIRKWLDLYQEHHTDKPTYREDIHYSFVEFGGANITHWSFLDSDLGNSEDERINMIRLCGNPLVVADKDKSEESPRHKKFKEELDDRYLVLPRREIENMLSAKTVESVVRDFEKNDSIKISEAAYNKNKNGYLGSFIDEKVLKLKGEKRFATNSGTIKSKVLFCKKAVANTTQFDQIPTETIDELVEKIYNFIHTENTD